MGSNGGCLVYQLKKALKVNKLALKPKRTLIKENFLRRCKLFTTSNIKQVVHHKINQSL